MLVEVAPDTWVNPSAVAEVYIDKYYKRTNEGRDEGRVVIRYLGGYTKTLPEETQIASVIKKLNEFPHTIALTQG